MGGVGLVVVCEGMAVGSWPLVAVVLAVVCVVGAARRVAGVVSLLVWV